MRCTSAPRIVGILAAGALQWPALSARAGGAELWEIGTADVGLASAGWAARAEDAATAFKNPAGMIRIEVPQLQVGLQSAYGNISFEQNGDTTVPGNDGGNAMSFIPNSSMFWAQRVHDRVAIGAGLFNYFGSLLSYGDGFVGRYQVEQIAMFGFSFMPSVSVEITDWLSVGAGFNVMLGLFQQQVAVSNATPMDPTAPDGTLKLSDHDVGFGADVGALLTIDEGTRVGVTYVSPVALAFRPRANFSGLSASLQDALSMAGLIDATIGIHITVPQFLTLSVYHELDDRWALMADLGWQDWSRFGKVGIEVDSAAPSRLQVDRRYKDTAHVAVGTLCRLVEDWDITFGFAYDSTPVSAAHRSVDAPFGNSYRFGTGALWHASRSIDLAFSYELLYMGNMSVDQTSVAGGSVVAGQFARARSSFLVFNVQWNIGAEARASVPTPSNAPPR